MVETPLNDLTLHHVGYATGLIEMAAERYVQRFGYRRVSPVVHDPGQTAYVQFLRLGEEQSYLELVAPDGAESKLSAAIRRGGGLNHLCYACDDLEATIARLETAGMRLISDPRPAVAFGGRKICWLLGEDAVPIELLERRQAGDLCEPGL